MPKEVIKPLEDIGCFRGHGVLYFLQQYGFFLMICWTKLLLVDLVCSPGNRF